MDKSAKELWSALTEAGHRIDKVEIRRKVIAVFAEMRREGFLARANFMCCGSCAGYDLATRASNMVDKGRPAPKGCVFWHHQDEQSFRESGQLYIAYGALQTQKHGELGISTVEVGNVLVGKLRAQGLAVEWNGDPQERILVKVG